MPFSTALSFVTATLRKLLCFARQFPGSRGEFQRGIRRFVDAVSIVFEYLAWLVQWGCWLLDWTFRLPVILFQHLGLEYPGYIKVSVRMVANEGGDPAVSTETVHRWLREAGEILRRRRIFLSVDSIGGILGERSIDTTGCNVTGLFRRYFSWFSSHTVGPGPKVTVYVVRSIRGASGCCYPGTDWILIGANADGTVVVHEIGHLCDLWRHSSDPDNIMTVRGGGSHDRLGPGQAAMIRSSRFARPLLKGMRDKPPESELE